MKNLYDFVFKTHLKLLIVILIVMAFVLGLLVESSAFEQSISTHEVC